MISIRRPAALLAWSTSRTHSSKAPGSRYAQFSRKMSTPAAISLGTWPKGAP
jgi:hypothetical protein